MSTNPAAACHKQYKKSKTKDKKKAKNTTAVETTVIPPSTCLTSYSTSRYIRGFRAPHSSRALA